MTADTDLATGLGEEEAARRLAVFGPNRPHAPRRPPYARLALGQLADPLVALLLGAAVVSIAIGDTTEGAAISAILVLNAVLGFWQEAGAERAVRALSESFTPTARVRRGGLDRTIDAAEVVPGDVLLLEAGDRVAADADVMTAAALEVDESTLTGESLPVAKGPGAERPGTPLAERTSAVHAGSGVTHGRAEALVTATGPATELGRIEQLTETARPPATPLERRLARLARQMVVVGIGITVTLAGLLLLRGEPAHEAFLLGVAVAVAAVPEGLAATVTAALALGGRAMAQRGAIVRRLEAIETLGETTVICSDKTGTLTQNRIRVAALAPAAGVPEEALLEAGALASPAGADPVETALRHAAAERGIEAGAGPVHELPFDSERRRATAVYARDGAHWAYSKGAPEVVLPPDSSALGTAADWAAQGFRVLAVAAARLTPGAALDAGVEDGLEPLGLVAFHDPLRPTAAASVAAARSAGIDVRMLTGDHPATAHTIGQRLGLDPASVVARATPADKLALVGDLQAAGEVVAVTGDGVNDAPALRKADVGVAMGLGGTEAAREAAAVVLTDDDFATIVAAVAEGRRIGDNIRTFVAFLLSANFGEVLLFAIAVAAGLDPPLAVIQVLLVNFLTDGLPALALARDPASSLTMSRPPHPGARLFNRRGWAALAAVGCLVGAAAAAAYLAGLAFGGGRAQTMAFATLALTELVVVFAIRSPTLPAWRLPANRWLLLSVAASASLVAACVYLPAAHEPFATVSLPPWPAATVVALALAPPLAFELVKAAAARRIGSWP